MCGIAGVMGRTSGESLEATLGRMVATLHHRGPDDEGRWTDTACGIGLGHKRLAILDLSPAGHQPMASASRRLVLAFNGEIYNHARIRMDLEKAGGAVRWRGHSDTETLLEAFDFWGVEETLDRAVGMFAFALWDASERLLYLARDRFGEKPLYYGWAGTGFLFASELKAIRATSSFRNPVNRQALAMYFDKKYVPSPWSIYQDIYKLEPGTLLTVRAAAPRNPPSGPLPVGATYDSLAIRRWWSMEGVVASGKSLGVLDNECEALEALEAQLDETIRLQSLADVPVGSFLSGGVDSSAVTAFMQGQNARPVKTFTVAFQEAGYDESAHASAVARHLGTDHTEVRVTGEQARAIVPSLPQMFDEPFADSSQIPTHLVSRVARDQVTVALSGDGGDEVFGGYNRYLWAPRIWEHVRWVPGPFRSGLAAGLGGLAGPWLEHLPTGFVRLNEKLQKLADALSNADSVLDMYRNLTGASAAHANLVIGHRPASLPSALETSPVVAALASEDPPAMMMYLDTMTYLPDDILCKVDRAAMTTSLETRVPFLDHRLVELAWRLPPTMRFREGQGKWALRQLLYRRVPRALIERPKAGFAIPVGQWLRGPLRRWADSLLDERRVRQGGYLDPAVVSQLWRTHLAGKRDLSSLLWAILMFESWRETFDVNSQEGGVGAA